MYRIDLACLKEIARVSNLLNHQNQQRKNDDVKLTNVREDQPVFYITQVESEWQRRIFLFGSRWKTIDRRRSSFLSFFASCWRRENLRTAPSKLPLVRWNFPGRQAIHFVCRFHDLRHTVVSRLIQAKIPI